ncbi:hypothetical protein OG352_05510 [Streptomyces sp. NBC_01485]|uniref:hypothetical protein n=1 Tax=Streptomyces sp. NBC_01485 TaxID=2903884 RepID=UPI002E2F8F9F|nr:hypothetical protein [Streptomyces sp. NBC_01485]
MSHPTFPRAFVVQRDEDVSGISGEGVVAEGVQFSDGWVATHWLDQAPMHEPKTDVWHNKGAAPFERVHGHGGRTRIQWADEVAAARSELVGDVINAFDVPASILGPEQERAHLHRQIERAVQAVQDGQAASVEIGDERIVAAVMPVVEQLLKQRDRWRHAVGRAHALAYRWQGAHGSSMFLVRTAGAELLDVLGDSEGVASDVVQSGLKPQASSRAGVDESGLECVCGDRVQWMAHPDAPGWIHSPGSDTSCASARPRCPECQMPHALIPGRPPWCRSIRACLVGADRIAAVECFALHTRFTPARQCIRAAQHCGDHIDEHGFHWSDTVAVYPVCANAGHQEHPGFTCAEVDQTRPYWNARWGEERAQGRGTAEPEPEYAQAESDCSNPDHVCGTCGDCVYEHPGEGGCGDKGSDIRVDKIGPTIPNYLVNEGEWPDNDSVTITVTDPAWLCRQYADAITSEHYRRSRERIVASPEEHSAAMADVVMSVRDRHIEQLRQRLILNSRWRRHALGSNDRQACPYCTGAPQFLRSELGAHVQEKHARVLAMLASGGSLDEHLADPETRCRLPHEMEG